MTTQSSSSPHTTARSAKDGTAKDALFFTILDQLTNGPTYFSNVAIRAAASGLPLKGGSFKVYLSEAVSTGLIHDAGRGWYSRLSKPAPLNFKPVVSLIRAVTKAFPLLDFSAWSTVQLNPWMHHLLAQPVQFLYAPAETLESIGEKLRELRWQVTINPTPTEGSKAVRPGPKSVVLRPAISKQPEGDRHRAPIEKILVDLATETPKLALMDASEADKVIETILDRHLVSFAAMRSYAERRGVRLAALEAINQRQASPPSGGG